MNVNGIIEGDNIEDLIVELRKMGLSIKQITYELDSRGIPVSEYRVWKILKEHELASFYEGYISLINKYQEVLALMILKTHSPTIKVLAMVDVKNFSLLGTRIKSRLTLRDSILFLETFEERLCNENTKLYLQRTPPLVPTRSEENKLTKYLKRKGIDYEWFSGKWARRVSRCLLKKLPPLKYDNIEIAEAEIEKTIRKKLLSERIRLLKWLEGQKCD